MRLRIGMPWMTTAGYPEFDRQQDALRIWSHAGRFEIDDREVREAQTLMLGDHAAMAEVDGAWLFLMRDGSLLRAPTFLGEPVSLGRSISVPFWAGWEGLEGSRGRLAVVRGGFPGELWASAGGAFEHMPAAGDAVRSATFLDAQHGAATLVGGVLVLTSDGGRTFRAVELSGPARSLYVEGDRFLVDVGPAFESQGVRYGRAHFVDREGRVEVTDRTPPQPMFAADDASGAARYSRYSRYRDQLPELSVDRAVRELRRAEVFRLVRADPPPELASCAFLAQWGTGRLAVCGAGPRRLRYAPRADAAFVEVPGVQLQGDPQHQVILDDDGAHLGIHAPCDTIRLRGDGKQDDEERADVIGSIPIEARPACIVDVRDGSMREIPMVTFESLFALHEGRALVVGRGGWTVPVRAYDAAGQPLALGPSEVATVDVVEGSIVIVDRSGAAWIGPIGSLERRALPSGAIAFSLSDARRGLAVGNTLADVWVTLDGARSFERVTMDAPRIELVARGLTSVRCGGEWCFAQFPRQRAELVTHGFGPQQSVPRAVVGGIDTSEGQREDRMPRPYLRCTATVDSDLAEIPEPSDAELAELRGSLGATELVARRDGTITWGRGLRTLAGPMPWGRTLELALATRELAIAAICRETCALVRARPGVAPEVLAEDLRPYSDTSGAISHHPSPAPEAWGVIARQGDSGFLVALGLSDAATIHALWLDRAGALVAQRTLAANLVLDEIDGRLVVIERIGSRSFALGPALELAPREVDTWIASGACEDDASGPERVEHILGEARLPLDLRGPLWRAVVRGGERPCIARVDAAGRWGGTLVPEGAGSFTGTLRAGGHEVAVTCGVRGARGAPP